MTFPFLSVILADRHLLWSVNFIFSITLQVMSIVLDSKQTYRSRGGCFLPSALTGHSFKWAVCKALENHPQSGNTEMISFWLAHCDPQRVLWYWF